MGTKHHRMRRLASARVLHERLESRRALAAVPFAEIVLDTFHEPIPELDRTVHLVDIETDGDSDLAVWHAGTLYWRSLLEEARGLGPLQSNAMDGSPHLAVDLNGDGNVDFLSQSASQLVWYANAPSTPRRFVPQLLYPGIVEDVYPGDLDADGDVDLMITDREGRNRVIHNLDGQFSEFRVQRLSWAPGARILAVGDVDGDRDMDAIVQLNQAVGLYRNQDAQWSFELLMEQGAGRGTLFDLTGDELPELILPTADGRTAVMFRNESGVLTAAWTSAPLARSILSVMVTDWNTDGRNDLLLTTDTGLNRWLLPLDNTGSPGTPEQIPHSANGSFQDVDSDGDLDLLLAFNTWRENRLGVLTSELHFEIDNHVIMLFAGDVDGDTDPDLIVRQRTEAELVWRANLDGMLGNPLPFPSSLVVDARPTGLPAPALLLAPQGLHPGLHVYASGDCVGEILGSCTLEYQYRAIDGPTSSATVLASNLFQVLPPRAADVDGDDHRDVLVAFRTWQFVDGAFRAGSRVVWYEFGDTEQTMASSRVLWEQIEPIRTLELGDFDGDNQLDLAVGGQNGVTFLTVRGGDAVVSTQVHGITLWSMADFDHDGKWDILAAHGEKHAAVYHQTASYDFAPGSLVSVTPNQRVIAADMDGDRLPDVVSLGTTATWTRNLGDRRFVDEPALIADGIDPMTAPLLLDFDHDGDLDLVYREPDFNQLMMARNRVANWDFLDDGLSNYHDVDQLAREISLAADTARHDIDNDGVVTANDITSFARDILSLVAGDANADHLVDNRDFVQMAQRGRFEANDGAIATWSDGDFDGDGRFNSRDLVLALTVLTQASPLAAAPTASEPFPSDLVYNGPDLTGSQTLTATDVDGDGYPELFVNSQQYFDVTQQGVAVDLTNLRWPASSFLIGDIVDGALPELLLSTPEGILVVSLANDPQGEILLRIPAPANLQLNAVADLDGDGRQDVVASDTTGAILFQQVAVGSFRRSLLSTSYGSEQLAAVDVDRDGDLDLQGDSHWIENLDGKAHFDLTARRLLPDVGNGTVVDLDGDGDQDYWHATRQTLTIGLRLADGSLFETEMRMPYGVLHGAGTDFQTDGIFDFLWGTPTGYLHYAFTTIDSPPVLINEQTTPLPEQLWFVDLDRDANLDAVGATPWTVFEFAPAVSAFLVRQARPLPNNMETLSSDLDGDGRADLLLLSNNARQILWQRNLGQRDFAPMKSIFESSEPIQGLTAADIDRDGREEILFPRHTTTVVDGRVSRATEIMAIAPTKADTEAWEASVVVTPGENYRQLLLMQTSDIDQDGIPELLTAWDHDAIVIFSLGKSNDSGHLIGEVLHYVAYNDPPEPPVSALQAADVDDDGRIDLVANVGVFHQLADGSFRLDRERSRFPIMQIHDLNGDGSGERIVVDSRIVISRPDEFDDWETVASIRASRHDRLVVADLDRDGDLDLLLGPQRISDVSAQSQAIVWLENQGAYQFAAHNFVVGTSSSFAAMHVADLDGNDTLDLLAVINDRHELHVFWNESATFHIAR